LRNRTKSDQTETKGRLTDSQQKELMRKKEIEAYLKPLEYEGHEIRTYSDILEFLNLDLMTKENVIKANAKTDKGEETFDPTFYKLINRVKPDIEYYKSSYGDKLLYIRRVDKLTYDIKDEEE
jgi:hypothetical protein